MTLPTSRIGRSVRGAALAAAVCLLGCGGNHDSGGDGAVDAGAVDAGAVDAGAVDAGAVDAGAVDGTVGAASVSWDPLTTTVAEGPNIALAFNSTHIGGRDGEGALHIVWTDGVDVFHGLVASGSHAFSVSALPRSPSAGPGVVSKPTLSFADGDTALVAWTVGSAMRRSIVISRSFDRGASWEAPTDVTTGHLDTPISLYATMRAGGMLGAVITWYDNSTEHVRTSAWNGTSWTSPHDLASGSGQSHDVGIGGYGDTVFAAWEDNRSGATSTSYGIYIASSSDAGLTWSADRLLPVSGDTSEGQDPSIAIRSDGNIFIGHQKSFERIVLTRSTDHGLTFEPYVPLGSGLFAHTVVSDTAMAVSWEGFMGDPHDPSIKTVALALSLDDLMTVSTPHALPGSESVFNAGAGAVLLSNRNIDVVWLDVTDRSNHKLQWRTGALR